MTYKETVHLGWMCVGFAIMSFAASFVGIFTTSIFIIPRIIFWGTMMSTYIYWLWVNQVIWEIYKRENLN